MSGTFRITASNRRPWAPCSNLSFQRLQGLDGVHVVELLRRHLQEEQVLLVPPDDGVAAVVLPQLQQLREKPGGEEAGVAPDAAVAQGGDLLRLGRQRSTSSATLSRRSRGWSLTWNSTPPQSRSSVRPRAMVWLMPQSGWGLWTAAKRNSPARRMTSGYWVTTTTWSNFSAGTASSARRIRLLPRSWAASLFSRTAGRCRRPSPHIPASVCFPCHHLI